MKNKNSFEMIFCATNFNTIHRSALLYKNTIIFSSSNLICIYSKDQQNIQKAQKMTNLSDISFVDLFLEQFILVGSEGGHIIILQPDTLEVLFQYKIQEKIRTGFIYKDKEDIYVLVGADGKFLVFKLSDKLELQEQIDFGTNYIECCSATIYNDISYILITACDNYVHVYKLQQDKLEFLNSLPGHQNKVKAISQNPNTTEFVTCSLDNYIRLWKIHSTQNFSIENKNVYHLENNTIVELVSVLLGHSNGINSIYFTKKGFVSCGLDCSVLIWEQDESGIWYNSNRLGQVYGNNNVYFGICANYNLDEILAWTFNGVPYLWHKQKDNWSIQGFLSGHSKKVTDIRWGNNGNTLASCSEDQTTRVFCKVKQQNNLLENYKELSRAQIHGYDINCISFLNLGNNFCDLLICGADEKILRILEPVPHFINLNNVLTNNQLRLYLSNEEENNCLISKEPLLYKAQYESGQEVLGLMTKQIKETRHNFYFDEDSNEHKKKELSLDEYKNLPSEDFLVTQTLWPELNKLYGHGYEISVLEASKDGKTLVSACKSYDQENANIIFWDLKNFKPAYSIKAHNFTIFDIKIHQDKLLTVSRDRQIALYKRIDDKFELIIIKNAHSRMIFSASFSLCGSYFVSGSRDKSIKLWKINEKDYIEISKVKFNSPVYSVEYLDNNRILAGLENGKINLIEIKNGKLEIQFEQQCFGKKINKIRRNPYKKNLFACCSDDNTSRIYQICNINQFFQ